MDFRTLPLTDVISVKVSLPNLHKLNWLQGKSIKRNRLKTTCFKQCITQFLKSASKNCALSNVLGSKLYITKMNQQILFFIQQGTNSICQNRSECIGRPHKCHDVCLNFVKMHHQKIKIAMLYMLTGISDCCFVCYGAKKVLNLYNFIFFI